jgi:hypothetical protein
LACWKLDSIDQLAPGASTCKLMLGMGQSSSGAALRYQHVMAGWDAAIGDALDELVQAGATRSEDNAALSAARG